MSAERVRQLVERAGWLHLNGDPDGARRLLEQVLQLDPGNATARTLLTSFTPVPLPPGALSAAQQSSARPSAPSGWDAAPGRRLVVDEPREGEGADPLQLLSEQTLAGATPPPIGVGDGAVPLEALGILLRGVRDLLELDDHSGAMDLLARAEALAPGHPEVLRMREESERVLMAMLESKLGDLQRCPRVRLREDEIIWLNLDHRAGFVLAQIDGSVSYEDLFALSGMSRLDTARILAQLVGEGVID